MNVEIPDHWRSGGRRLTNRLCFVLGGSYPASQILLRTIRVGSGVRAEHALVLQPGETAIGPGGTGQVARSDAKSVTALRVDVQFSGHVRPFQSEVHQHAV